MVQKINMLLNNRSYNKPRQTQPTQTVNQPRQTQPRQTVNQPRQTQPTQTVNQPTTSRNRFNVSSIYKSTRKSCG